MMHTDSNPYVVLFFIVSTLMLAYLAYTYLREKKSVFRFFGLGLALISLAFAAWSYIVYARPDNLATISSIAVLPLVGAFAAFLASAAAPLKAKHKTWIYVAGAILLGVLALLRLFYFESHPSFSQAGYFYFNSDPAVLYAYALAISFTMLPSVYVVGRQLKNSMLRVVMELGFTLVTMGTVILITSYDEKLQFINGCGLIVGITAVTLAHIKYRLNSK